MRKLLVVLFLACAALSAAAQEAEEEKKREPGLYAQLDTTMGRIVFKLYEKESPNTVKNFVLLANGKQPWRHPRTGEEMKDTRYFDGQLFHRVIPRFMIQTGDPTGTGMGGPGYTIRDEFENNLKFNKPGVVGMANSGPNTGGSQFFITHLATPGLTGKHTIFGQVVEGQKVVVAIGNASRGERDRPNKDIVINKVTIIRIVPPAPKEPEP